MQPTLICYDGSDEAEQAIDMAAGLLASRPAVVVTIAPPMTFAEGMLATSSLVPGGVFEDLNTADAMRRAERGAEHASARGLAAEALEAAAPTTWEGIVDVAEEIDAAVIVVGSRGLSGLHELAAGSVSHSLATHARRPVLIVPPAQ